MPMVRGAGKCRTDPLKKALDKGCEFFRDDQVDRLAGLGLARREAQMPLRAQVAQMPTDLHHGEIAEPDRAGEQDCDDQRVPIEQLVPAGIERPSCLALDLGQELSKHHVRRETRIAGRARRRRPAIKPVGQILEPAPVALRVHALHDAFEADQGRCGGARGDPVDQAAGVGLDPFLRDPLPGVSVALQQIAGRAFHGPWACIRRSMSAIIGACGQADGRESLIRVFSCSTRTAILRNAARRVSKVAVRQRDRFCAAPRSRCSSQ